MSLGGQVRVVAGFGAARIIGWDMTAALAVGRAMGIDELLIADVLPAVEAVMVRAMRRADGGS